MNSRTEEMLSKHYDELGQEYARLQNNLGNRLEKPRHKKQEKRNKLIEERRKRHEIIWAKQISDRQKAIKLKARNEEQKIDKYRLMEFSELVKDYLATYFVVKIWGKPNSDQAHLLSIIGREVKEHRSQVEQERLKNKVKLLNWLTVPLFKGYWLSNAFKKVISWISGKCQ